MTTSLYNIDFFEFEFCFYTFYKEIRHRFDYNLFPEGHPHMMYLQFCFCFSIFRVFLVDDPRQNKIMRKISFIEPFLKEVNLALGL